MYVQTFSRHVLNWVVRSPDRSSSVQIHKIEYGLLLLLDRIHKTIWTLCEVNSVFDWKVKLLPPSKGLNPAPVRYHGNCVYIYTGPTILTYHTKFIGQINILSQKGTMIFVIYKYLESQWMIWINQVYALWIYIIRSILRIINSC